MARVTHIVVVDDESEIRESIDEYLTMHGFKVSQADGGTALRRLFAFTAPYRGRLVWAVIGMAVYAVGFTGQAYLVKPILDEVQPHVSMTIGWKAGSH